MCEDGYCVENLEYPLGNYALGSNQHAEYDYIYFMPITAPHDAALLRFGLRSMAAGITYRMALYSDSNGAPDTRLSQSSNGVTVVTSDTVVAEVSAASGYQLTANTTYWLVAIFSNPSHTTQMRFDWDGGAEYYYLQRDWSDGFPITLEEEDRGYDTGVAYNYYIVVQDR
jgi:hypothetical protein